MNSRNVLQPVISLAIVTLLVVGCGPQQTAPAATSAAEAPATTPTAVTEAPAATSTPVPPTPTPGFKDPSLCPDSDKGVLVPERLPNVQFSIMDSPSSAVIKVVEALSATNVWAADDDGMAKILHYDGSVWTAMESHAYHVGGFSMLSADEGWAVSRDYILHYTNQHWSKMDAKDLIVKGYTYPNLGDIDFMAPDNGWAVGDVILHYDGDDWIEFPLGSGRLELNRVDMVSADEGWAVGDYGRILHYQGSTWQRVDSPVETDLMDVAMRSPQDGWIVGRDSTILHFDGTAWSITAAPTQAHLYGVAVDGKGEAWAVGSGGTVLRFDGQTWAKMEIDAIDSSWDVDISDDGAIWIVGGGGLIARGELLDTDVPPPSSPALKTIDNSDGDGNFSVSWGSVPGYVKYVLQEADESMCPITIYFGPETLKEVSRKDIGTYYYRVSALGVSGQSEWSEIQSVKVTVPPPPRSVECTASSGGLLVEITCESGGYSSPGVFSYEGTGYYPRWDKELWGTHFTEERTYEDSGNMYEVHAFIWTMSGVAGGRGYYVEVTGGVFGEAPETCDVHETLAE